MGMINVRIRLLGCCVNVKDAEGCLACTSVPLWLGNFMTSLMLRDAPSPPDPPVPSTLVQVLPNTSGRLKLF